MGRRRAPGPRAAGLRGQIVAKRFSSALPGSPPLDRDQPLTVLHPINPVDLGPVDPGAAVDAVAHAVDRANEIAALGAADHVRAPAACQVVRAGTPDQLVVTVAPMQGAAVGCGEQRVASALAEENPPRRNPGVAALRGESVAAAASLDQEDGELAGDIGIVIAIEIGAPGREAEAIGGCAPTDVDEGRGEVLNLD